MLCFLEIGVLYRVTIALNKISFDILKFPILGVCQCTQKQKSVYLNIFNIQTYICTHVHTFVTPCFYLPLLSFFAFERHK